ncbi:MAG: antiviral reverse transcriptase Drt3b [Parachlamydiaceae bacterium]
MLEELGGRVKKINRIKRNDYNRTLITETLPYETPIVFSNDGLYNQVSTFEDAGSIQKTIINALVFGEGLPKSVNSTQPYLYKVRKNSQEYRRLALLHPLSQWQIKKFYEKYEQLILHYCSLSPASIRSPRKVAGSFYNKSSWENINQYKKDAVMLTIHDRYVKHTPSYFAYHGYDRLYKFFNSRDYFSLEKQFSVLMTLDVSKCFDSIYTHSLSWSVKDKEFTKANVSVSSTFAQEFDRVMRHGNHNETNGIPIGPEACRIFAEIIFQDIDRQTIEKLGALRYGVDYTFRRYVDDVFIFSDSEDAAKIVYKAYADALIAFNLHANTSKSSVFQRPFLTQKSRLIFEAGQRTNEFVEKFLDDSETGTLVPRKIFSKWKITKSYIDSIKALCSSSSANYDEVASFLISVINERIKKLVNNDLSACDNQDKARYADAIEVLMDILFFLYSVAPSVGASYKFSTSLILIFRFCKKHLSCHSEAISQILYSLALKNLYDQSEKVGDNSIDGFVNLEKLNIVLSIRELGRKYLLPPEVFENLFLGNRKLSYFTIVSCLYYIQTEDQYKLIRKKLIKYASSRLGSLTDVFMSSEKAYLFVDLLSCPFVHDSYKSDWLCKFYSVLQKAKPSTSEIEAFLAAASNSHWHVNWTDVDLLNSLEKKELNQAY